MIPECLSFPGHPGHCLVGFNRVGDANQVHAPPLWNKQA
jgi:hypothetical protein